LISQLSIRFRIRHRPSRSYFFLSTSEYSTNSNPQPPPTDVLFFPPPKSPFVFCDFLSFLTDHLSFSLCLPLCLSHCRYFDGKSHSVLSRLTPAAFTDLGSDDNEKPSPSLLNCIPSNRPVNLVPTIHGGGTVRILNSPLLMVVLEFFFSPMAGKPYTQTCLFPCPYGIQTLQIQPRLFFAAQQTPASFNQFSFYAWASGLSYFLRTRHRGNLYGIFSPYLLIAP